MAARIGILEGIRFATTPPIHSAMPFHDQFDGLAVTAIPCAENAGRRDASSPKNNENSIMEEET